MPKKSFSSLTDQVADLLRHGMAEGRWRDTLPGRDRLAKELDCSHGTVEEAMQRLSREGLLVSQGAGRRRKIVLSGEIKRASAFRVKVLCYEKTDRVSLDLFNQLINQLQEVGHEASFASKALLDLGMDVKRIARYVEKIDTDAWVVVGGSREVLEWFAEKSIITFALFGSVSDVKLASTGVGKALARNELIDRLYDLGHRRIVTLVREANRIPALRLSEKNYLRQLEKKGIQTSEYNLPNWGDHPEDLYRIMDSLFKYTAPTAMIIDTPVLLVAVLQHLGRLGIAVPDQVSLACTDNSPFFDWCIPSITHIAWDQNSIVRRVVKWVGNTSHGKDDRSKIESIGKLVIGGTLGPVLK